MTTNEVSKQRRSSFEILLVEDNPGDVRLTRECLREANLTANLWVVRDGIQAMAFLKREGMHNLSPRPDLILLDLNLPRVSGREVLSMIKSEPAYRAIPIVVLSSSTAEEDVKQCYDLHANCYVAKPVDLNGLTSVMKAIEAFWLQVVQLPPNSDDWWL
jgi:two-component system, chemotaxis family, response regulator Rcp1